MRYLSVIFLLAAVLLSASPAWSEPLDINSADASTLAQGITGVGEAKAMAIVEYREAHGPFTSVDELSNIKGIGMKTIDKNRDKLTAIIPEK